MTVEEIFKTSVLQMGMSKVTFREVRFLHFSQGWKKIYDAVYFMPVIYMKAKIDRPARKSQQIHNYS